MSLIINKKEVASIFRLIGNNENALTFALGYTFSQNTAFLIEFLKHKQIIPKIQGKNYLNEFSELKVSLQKYNDDKSGIKDIVVESKDLRLVIEAKTDSSFPSEKQIMKYADNNINIDWDKYDKKYILLLTRRQISIDSYKNVALKLKAKGIVLSFSSWGDIYGLLRNYSFESPNTIQEFILTEFAKFISKDYEVNIIEKEVMYRKVLKQYYETIANQEGYGYYFDGAVNRSERVYPSCQFFLACYGPARTSSKTAEFMRKILSYEKLSFEEITNKGDVEMQIAFDRHLSFFPNDRNNSTFHVFKLGKKIPIHPTKRNFDGSELGYFDIEYLLTE